MSREMIKTPAAVLFTLDMDYMLSGTLRFVSNSTDSEDEHEDPVMAAQDYIENELTSRPGRLFTLVVPNDAAMKQHEELLRIGKVVCKNCPVCVLHKERTSLGPSVRDLVRLIMEASRVYGTDRSAKEWWEKKLTTLGLHVEGGQSTHAEGTK